MVAEPVAMPLTMPLPEPTVATEVVLLLHAPPVVPLVYVAVDPIHTLLGPPIAPGVGSSVKVAGPEKFVHAVASSVARAT